MQQNNNTQRNSSWDVPYTFSGKEKDVETGYSYFGARYYDSDLSVWLSVDPLASKYPSMSAYMYTAGNPVMLVDPDGMRIGDGKLLNKTWNWVRGHGFEEGKYSGTFYGKHRKLDAESVQNLDSWSKASKKEYIRYWEKTNGKKTTKDQRKLLKNGCIGVVQLSNEKNGHPSTSVSFSNPEQAMEYAKKMREEGKSVILFSLEFHTDTPEKFEGNPKKITTHSIYVKDNVADYNYALYDFESNSWWGANHYDKKGDGMTLYKYSTQDVVNGLYSDYEGHIYSVIVN